MTFDIGKIIRVDILNISDEMAQWGAYQMEFMGPQF
jgi:hypothetical protein